MRPKTFSATALNVANLCLARYKAEMIDRGKGQSGLAANLGSSVHGALEMYVKNCIMESKFPATVDQLLEFFKMSFMSTFGTSDLMREDYFEGVEMLKAWHKRTDFTGVTVLSCEVKENFPINTSIGPIPFNFIWDRHDQIGPNEYKVVDYKTNRWGISPQDLKKKIQARAYGLAAQIKHPDAERIWVEFDMLRHDGPVGIVFTREENAAFWRFLKEEAKRIIDTPDDEVKETINAECNFCPRKVSCGALKRNIAVGGIASVGGAAGAVDLRTSLEWQKKAIDSAIKELDEVILTEARASDVFEFESDLNRMEVTVGSRRAVDAERAAMVLGPALFDKYGGKTFTLTTLDRLVKGNEITDEQKRQLKSLVYRNPGEPKVKVSSKNPIDED